MSAPRTVRESAALAEFVAELAECAPPVGGRCAICKCLALVCVDMLLPTPGDLVCAECAFFGRDLAR